MIVVNMIVVNMIVVKVLVSLFIIIALFVMYVLHKDAAVCEWFENKENETNFYKKFADARMDVYVCVRKRCVFLSVEGKTTYDRLITLSEAIKLYKKKDLQKALKKRFK